MLEGAWGTRVSLCSFVTCVLNSLRVLTEGGATEALAYFIGEKNGPEWLTCLGLPASS